MRASFLCCSSIIISAAMLLAPGPVRAEEPGPMEKALQPLVKAHTLSGAVVLVATPAKVLDVEAVGFADIAAKRAMEKDELFWIASMSKPMTAVALMMLVDEGKVSLDDPVEKYLPSFKDMKVIAPPPPPPVASAASTNAAAASVPLASTNSPVTKAPATNAPVATGPVFEAATHPFTIRECLWHGAGLKFASAFEKPTLDQHPLADRVESYAHEPLARQPGTASVYANEGPNIAGRIIEVVTGRPYEEFLQQRLFTPLGMTDTTFFPTKEQLARLATVYRTSPDKTGLVASTVTQLTYPLDGPGRYSMPAGGLFSTAQDVGKFCQMIANHGEWAGRRYLSDQSWAEMKTRQSPPADKQAVGVIWRLGGETISHGGAYRTNMRIDLAKHFITVFLVQQDGAWPAGAKDADTVFEQAATQAFLPHAPAKTETPDAPDPSRNPVH